MAAQKSTQKPKKATTAVSTALATTPNKKVKVVVDDRMLTPETMLKRIKSVVGKLTTTQGVESIREANEALAWAARLNDGRGVPALSPTHALAGKANMLCPEGKTLNEIQIAMGYGDLQRTVRLVFHNMASYSFGLRIESFTPTDSWEGIGNAMVCITTMGVRQGDSRSTAKRMASAAHQTYMNGGELPTADKISLPAVSVAEESSEEFEIDAEPVAV